MIGLRKFFPKGEGGERTAVFANTNVSKTLDWLKTKGTDSSFLKRISPWVLVVAIAFMAADLTGIYSRSLMLPKSAPPAKRESVEPPPYKPRTDFNDILARNIFNSDGIIPNLQIAGTEQAPDISGPAKESQLPLQLVGTIVHANPGRSVATIELKGNGEKILPYIPNDDIEGMATLIKVERKKAFLRNLSSGALEYIQIKDDSGFSFQKKKSSETADGPITKESDDTFAIARTDLESQMNNLPELLTQARAVPNMVGNKVDGFKVVDIQDSSIFKKLGIQPGDVINCVDNEALDSPAKAMEMYNALRSKSTVHLCVERSGRKMTMTYNIR